VFHLCVYPDGLFESTDDGRSWTRLLAARVAVAAADEAIPGRLAVAGADGLWLREAGGEWQPAGAGLPNAAGAVPAFAGAGLLAGTRGNGVFRRPL
jgi:hypothetical protein